MNEKKWSIYQIPTKEEQGIFKKLIGDAFETEALLVSTHETKDYTEYIFIYNHPTEGINNLVSFYGKIDNKKAKKFIEKALLEFATSQLTEVMVTSKSKIKTYSKNVNLVEEIASSIKFDIPEIFHEEKDASSFGATADVTIDHSNKSQYKYGLYHSSNPDRRIGSFSCVVTKEEIYHIVTSKHNCEKDDNGYYLYYPEKNKKISLGKPNKGTLDYALLSFIKDEEFINELLKLKLKSVSEDKVTAYHTNNEDIKNCGDGDSGGNLHSNSQYYVGVYNSKSGSKNVLWDTIKIEQKLTDKDYIG